MKPIKKFLLISAIIFSALVFVSAVGAQIDYECARNAILNGQNPAEVCPGGVTPAEQPDVTIIDIGWDPTEEGLARLVRSGIVVALGVFFLLAVIYGIYGMYMRTTAGDNEDKLKQSVSIFKNALLAVVLIAVGLIIVQILSIMLGLGNIWELSFRIHTSGCNESEGSCVVYEDGGGTCLAAINRGNHGECCVYNFSGGRWVKDPNSCSKI